MKKHTVRSLQSGQLRMLTCYDYQTARILNDSDVDMILVGDSVGNVVLGYDTTVQVSLEEMRIFSAAVKRGAPNKFVVADLPFGTYATVQSAIENGISLFQQTGVEAVKLEGSNPINYEAIKRLTEIGVPVMGHIGLMPQSVHSQGGYYKHGKTSEDKERLLNEAIRLQDAGCFSIVLECVAEDTTKAITETLNIPTIGIGSGSECNGQVLVLNDLLGMTEHAPSFVTPMGNLYKTKSEIISEYLSQRNDTYN